MNKLVTIVLLILTLIYVVFVVGAVLVWYDEPEPGDGYLLVYTVIALAVSAVALGRQLFYSKSITYKGLFLQVVVVLLMLAMTGLGLFAAAAFALNITEPDSGYVQAAILCIAGVIVCGGLIWGVGKVAVRRGF